jgi:hypothetical protein
VRSVNVDVGISLAIRNNIWVVIKLTMITKRIKIDLTNTNFNVLIPIYDVLFLSDESSIA